MYSTGTTVSNIVFSGASGSASQIQWIVSDQLGTPRMIIDDTGSLATIKRHDYLPFGEDLSTIGGRTAAQGYSVGDGVRQQFTSKERDVETGLDYFNARYYSSIQGRFTSPDEFTGGPLELYYFAASASANPTFYADVRNPQSLNKYQYSYNNPLRYVDPNGHAPDQDPKCACPTDQRIIEDILSLPDTVADATGISALADWLRATVPAIVKHIAASQKCMDPGTCGQSIIIAAKNYS